ncbi:MAG TPA: carbohydrate-binding family 9-like protein [Sphingobacteriaceae bacterium]
MRKLSGIALIALVSFIYSFSPVKNPDDPIYTVTQLSSPMQIDANWDKREWKRTKGITLTNFMGEIPAFKPLAKAKMMYDKDHLYLIFRVKDRHVRIQTRNFNGPVSGDACVEFFFSPDQNFPLRYFNLEINAGGVPLMGYHTNGQKEFKLLQPDELKLIKIAHSLPGNLEQEIAEPVTWTVECRIPLSLLQKYTAITTPEKGIGWKANFYKTSSRSSNPHWITWAPVSNPKPNFHLPQFFGTIVFN